MAEERNASVTFPVSFLLPAPEKQIRARRIQRELPPFSVWSLASNGEQVQEWAIHRLHPVVLVE